MTPTINNLRVLVVDDSPDIREFVSEYILKPRGFRVETARDGADGLRKALSQPPDLILMDVEMPKLTGLQVLRELRQAQHRSPIILMTSHGSEQVAVEGFRLGVHDYVTKPFTPEEMLSAIEQALYVTRLQQEKETLTHQVMQINQQLEQYIHDLNALNEVGKSITALTSPATMLERIADAVLFMTHSQECALNLVNPETGQLREPIRRRAVGSTGLLAASAAPATTLAVPLQLGQKVVGNLRISKPAGESFSWHDERLLGMLADYAAIAIHNMQLVHQLQLTKEREKQQIRGVFERYVAPSVVEQVLAWPGQVSLGGTRQKVAVLFADLRGFSTFSARTEPEILVSLLNQYLRVAAEAVLAEEGTLDKFMGDAIMAFFNAPLPQPDYSLRAVRAAWKLCRWVERLHQRTSLADQLKFGVGVGVGEVIVGNIGTPQMMNFTIIGDTVNKAKRLQESAGGGQILIGQETYQLVQHHIEARCVDHIQLKGQAQPEPVYEVLAVKKL